LSGPASANNKSPERKGEIFMKLKRVFGWAAIVILIALVGWFLISYLTSSNSCDDPNAGPPANPMKAIIYCDYGTAEVLKLEDVEKPAPDDDQVLVKIRAAAINPLDWHYMRGTPYIMRLSAGLRKPKEIRLGVDYAGTVEAVGKNVTQFKPGDDVYGARDGALGEYVVARADRSVVLKPANLSFDQAAGVPVAAVTALQGLRDKGKLQPGQKVLINGASGGVGTFAVQIAKSMGANVTGVCSTRNLELVRSLGADQVIDYTTTDYTASDALYDVILDNVGNRSLSENRRVLKREGIYVLIGGGGPDAGNWIGPLGKPIKMLFVSPFVSQEMGMLLADVNKAELTALNDLFQSGKVTPVIDRRYPLGEVPEAIRYLESGRARGKVIITLE
jgi:NADPH:quinone reductase-like Zn-dependent oxidoreductase